MKQVNGSTPIPLQPHRLTEEELLNEALNSKDPMVQTLAKWLDELYRPFEEAMLEIGYDNDPRMILKDYQNADLRLDDFLADEWWLAWDADNRNELHLTDPGRATRCDEAAADGSDGSTHAERILDMRKALQSHDAADTFGQLTVDRLLIEIEALWDWFELKGQLDDQPA